MLDVREGSLLAPQRRSSVKLLSGFQKPPAKFQSSTSYIAPKRMTEQGP